MKTFNFQDTEVELTLNQIFVWPQQNGLNNVIGKVNWSISFNRNGAQSRGQVDTLLSQPQAAEFVPIEQVTPDQALDWALAAQGGTAYVDYLYRIHHNERLTYLERQVGLVPWDLGAEQP